MENRYRGPKGGPGDQGPPGPPCVGNCQNYLPKPINTRLFTEGGKKSIFPIEQRIILDSEERISLYLPEMDWGTEGEIPEDFYYLSHIIIIYCMKGNHLLICRDAKINTLCSSVELQTNYKYEIISGIRGWYMMQFKCKIED